jgi:peptidoglycan/LPS O-acetylase OafA/YrhL
VGVVGFVSEAGNGAATMAAPFVFAAAIYVFAQEGGPLSLLLRSKPACRLGDWSYSIYMTHMLIITLLIELCSAVEKITGTALLHPAGSVGGELFTLDLPHSAMAADGLTLICLGFTIIVSALTFRLVEGPGRAYFARLADHLRGTAKTGTRAIPTVVA